MKALSIRQPWAHFIAAGIKGVENRSTLKNFRGEFLIHASKIFDDEGSQLPRGDVGEICVRGPNVMLGYLKVDNPGVIQPPEDGWHDTGDIVAVEEWRRSRALPLVRGDAEDVVLISGKGHEDYQIIGKERTRGSIVTQDMMRTLAQTGNGWMTFKDASNEKCNQTGATNADGSPRVVHLSNLCTEILEVTSEGETAVCKQICEMGFLDACTALGLRPCVSMPAE